MKAVRTRFYDEAICLFKYATKKRQIASSQSFASAKLDPRNDAH